MGCCIKAQMRVAGKVWWKSDCRCNCCWYFSPFFSSANPPSPSCCECQLITTHSWLSLENCSWLNRSCLLSTALRLNGTCAKVCSWPPGVKWYQLGALEFTCGIRLKLVSREMASLLSCPPAYFFPCCSSLESIPSSGNDYWVTQHKRGKYSNGHWRFWWACSLCHFLHLFSIYVSLSAFCLLLYSFLFFSS